MLICLVIGPAAAFLGHGFTGLILGLRERFRQWQNIPSWVKPGIGGLSVGLIGITVFHFTHHQHHGVFSIGYDDLNSALNGTLAIQVIILLLIGKVFATAICYAAGGSGGIFAPVLFIGSMLGGLFGVALGQVAEVHQNVAAGAALLGTGAFFAAVIRCPMTSILIIFEMTRNYSLILPLMVGNLIAYVISAKLRPIPIYDALLLQDGISLKKMPAYRGEQDWRNLPISTIMTHDCRTAIGVFNALENLESIKDSGHVHHGYPVLDDLNSNQLVGMIMHHELEELHAANDEQPIRSHVAEQKVVRLYPDDSIREAANILVIKDVLQAPVVSRKDPKKLLGIVTLHDIARQQNAIEESLERNN